MKIYRPGILKLANVALVLLAGATLTGCFFGRNPDARCNDVAEYRASRNTPGVVVPEGLTAPKADTSYALPPAGSAGPAPEVGPGVACLDRPPDFFGKNPADPPG